MYDSYDATTATGYYDEWGEYTETGVTEYYDSPAPAPAAEGTLNTIILYLIYRNSLSYRDYQPPRLGLFQSRFPKQNNETWGIISHIEAI